MAEYSFDFHATIDAYKTVTVEAETAEDAEALAMDEARISDPRRWSCAYSDVELITAAKETPCTP